MMKNLSQIKIEVLRAAESPSAQGRHAKIPFSFIPSFLKEMMML